MSFVAVAVVVFLQVPEEDGLLRLVGRGKRRMTVQETKVDQEEEGRNKKRAENFEGFSFFSFFLFFKTHAHREQSQTETLCHKLEKQNGRHSIKNLVSPSSP